MSAQRTYKVKFSTSGPLEAERIVSCLSRLSGKLSVQEVVQSLPQTARKELETLVEQLVEREILSTKRVACSPPKAEFIQEIKTGIEDRREQPSTRTLHVAAKRSKTQTTLELLLHECGFPLKCEEPSLRRKTKMNAHSADAVPTITFADVPIEYEVHNWDDGYDAVCFPNGLEIRVLITDAAYGGGCRRCYSLRMQSSLNCWLAGPGVLLGHSCDNRDLYQDVSAELMSLATADALVDATSNREQLRAYGSIVYGYDFARGRRDVAPLLHHPSCGDCFQLDRSSLLFNKKLKRRVLVDGKIGIIRQILPRFTKMPYEGFFEYAADVSSVVIPSGKVVKPLAGGAGTTRAEALLKVIGEAIERYCAAPPCLPEAKMSDFFHLSGSALNPEELAAEIDIRSDRKSPERLMSSERVHWIRGTSLLSWKAMWVPATAVFTHFFVDGKRLIPFGTSDGLASGDTFQGAAVAGLLELIERDATMSVWLRRVRVPKIEIEGTDIAQLESILRHLHDLGLAVECYDCRFDIDIPVVLAVVKDPCGRYPAVAFGSAAHVDAGRACLKAIGEAMMVRHTLQLSPPTSSGQLLATQPRARSFLEHTYLHALPENQSWHDFLGKGGSVSLKSFSPIVSGLLETLLDRFSQTGLDPVIVDITTSDVRACQTHVVKAVAPLMQCRYEDDNMQVICSRVFRIEEAKEYDMDSGINPVTHPFG